MIKKIFVFVSIALCGFCMTACNYSLGSKNQLDFSSVTIAPIVNRVDLPQAQAVLARNIADSLNQEAGIKTQTSGGDAELQVAIVGYERMISATSSQDSTIASAVVLKMTLECSLLNTRNGKYYFKNRKVSVSREIYIGAESGLAETQAFPGVSRDAARKVKDLIISVW